MNDTLFDRQGEWFAPQPYTTLDGTRYLTAPGVIPIACTVTDLSLVDPFLTDLDSSWGAYLSDPPEPLTDPEALLKFAGQLCYQSFGQRRTRNADAGKYFLNLKQSKHGSVLEHSSISLLIYGISRACSHEVIRHRAGFAYSQVSQRYVSDEHLRFVEGPEHKASPELHRMFMDHIDRAVVEYRDRMTMLLRMQQEQNPIMTGEQQRDLRKKV